MKLLNYNHPPKGLGYQTVAKGFDPITNHSSPPERQQNRPIIRVRADSCRRPLLGFRPNRSTQLELIFNIRPIDWKLTPTPTRLTKNVTISLTSISYWPLGCVCLVAHVMRNFNFNYNFIPVIKMRLPIIDSTSTVFCTPAENSPQQYNDQVC